MLGLIHTNNHIQPKVQTVTNTTYPSLPLIREGDNWVLYGESTQVQTTPKNLFNGIMELGYYRLSDGTKQPLEGLSRSVSPIRVFPNTQYTVSRNKMAETGSKSLAVRLFNADGSYGAGTVVTSNGSNSVTFTTSATDYYIGINNDTVDLTTLYQLELGSVATSIVAYSVPKPSANVESAIINTYKKGTYQNTINGIIYQYELDSDLLQCGTFKDKLTINTASKTVKIDRKATTYTFTGLETFVKHGNTKINTFFCSVPNMLSGLPIRGTGLSNYSKDISNTNQAFNIYNYDVFNIYEDPLISRIYI